MSFKIFWHPGKHFDFDRLFVLISGINLFVSYIYVGKSSIYRSGPHKATHLNGLMYTSIYLYVFIITFNLTREKMVNILSYIYEYIPMYTCSYTYVYTIHVLCQHEFCVCMLLNCNYLNVSSDRIKLRLMGFDCSICF